MLSDSTLKFGEQFCTALLGLDALYAEEQAAVGSTDGSSIERLVVLNMSKTHQPDALGSYDKAIARFAELRDQAASLPEADRQLYYAQASQSAIAFAEWRSAGLAFAPSMMMRFSVALPMPLTNAAPFHCGKRLPL